MKTGGAETGLVLAYRPIEGEDVLVLLPDLNWRRARRRRRWPATARAGRQARVAPGRSVQGGATPEFQARLPLSSWTPG